tara:strand:+ start:1196 stop:2188 length:993 start_codon:yes stop_codon:yes gene_type:complete
MKVKGFPNYLTNDLRLKRLIKFAESVADTPHPLLLLGETGTGKDLFAEEFHRASGSSGPLVAENVAGLDEQLFADALFGHTTGAYTGAVSDRQGLIEKAEGGTLFLDEIGDLSVASQIKLLRVIENRTYFRLGSDEPLRVNARFVFATSSNLLTRIKNGLFRPDLYFRLSAYEVHLPPLRERKEDLRLLIRHFVASAAESIGRENPTIKPGFVAQMEKHSFPGNVRELKMLVLKAVTFAQDGVLDEETGAMVLDNHLMTGKNAHILIDHDPIELSDDIIRFPSQLPTMLETRKALVAEALRRTGGNQSKAAKLLGLTPAAVNKFLSKYQL